MDAVTRPTPVLDAIAPTVSRLRSLVQVSVQDQWRSRLGDLEAGAVPDVLAAQSWPVASLNDRGHIAWERGRTVLWLAQRLTVPTAIGAKPLPIGDAYDLTNWTMALDLCWWAEDAQIFVNGVPVQAGDLFDAFCQLPLGTAQPGETLDLAIRLESPGHDNGALVRSQWRFSAPDLAIADPGQVAAELVMIATYLDRPLDDPSRPEPETLMDAIAAIAWEDLPNREIFDHSLQGCRDRLLAAGWGSFLKGRTLWPVGHAHLDMAWLWPLADTWQAAERTFTSVLNLLDEFPEATFCHSSPALFEWLETHRPELFERLRGAIAAGRFEVAAGLWVEPELNYIGPEAIARQILYGQRYSQIAFKDHQNNPIDQRIAWLPDTFGFCQQLPQFLKLGGIDYFCTQKLRWNDTTAFPHGAFWWIAPDGSRVLGLTLPPIGTDTDAIAMATHGADWEAQTGLRDSLWLPGMGDHGGGPTREMLQTARRWAESDLFPRVEWGTALAYGDRVRTSPLAAQFPEWQTELYLEFHRGCYTTYGRQKIANRRTESLLYGAELWMGLAAIAQDVIEPQSDREEALTRDRADLETAWKKVLLNQFHDILPGSAIPEAYEDADRDWAITTHLGQTVLDRALIQLAGLIERPTPPHPAAIAHLLFNGLGGDRAAVVALPVPHSGPWRAVTHNNLPCLSQPHRDRDRADQDQLLVAVPNIPAFGYGVVWLMPEAKTADIDQNPQAVLSNETENAFYLENEHLRVTIDRQTGQLIELWDLARDRQVLAAPSNVLEAFRDRGQYWDAWNIDPAYEQHPLEPPKCRAVTWGDRGPARSEICVTYHFGESDIEQTYRLDAHSQRLDVHTRAHWQETHVLLKAAFHWADQPDRATYETPAGAIARPTVPQTDAERAQWEVPGLRWGDLSGDRGGVSLLAIGKHGYDARPGRMRLSLLRGSVWPDPNADRGDTAFIYGLFPHGGDWRTAGTVAQALDLDQPIRAIALPEDDRSGPTPLPPATSLLTIAPANLVTLALKPSEEAPHRWIWRGHDATGQGGKLQLGGWLGQRLTLGDRLNLLEAPLDTTQGDGGDRAIVRPWEIVTRALERS
ncbi:MAG: glycoside hydrolase family 38 C-terminal domain-containing protein [Cyanophyceae cyanobacterium]